MKSITKMISSGTICAQESRCILRRSISMMILVKTNTNNSKSIYNSKSSLIISRFRKGRAFNLSVQFHFPPSSSLRISRSERLRYVKSGKGYISEHSVNTRTLYVQKGRGRKRGVGDDAPNKFVLVGMYVCVQLLSRAV